MIRLLGKLPLKPVIALSGGVDSMAVADFVSRSRSVQCAFFHHGTDVSEAAEKVVSDYCQNVAGNCIVGILSMNGLMTSVQKSTGVMNDIAG